MQLIEYLCESIQIDYCELSVEERVLLDADILNLTCRELKKQYSKQYEVYFRALKYDKQKEATMLDDIFFKCIVNDIVSSDCYSIPGIAYHTREPEDVIYDIAIGKNTSPSVRLSNKIIDLHRTVRPDLYKQIITKILTMWTTQNKETQKHLS